MVHVAARRRAISCRTLAMKRSLVRAIFLAVALSLVPAAGCTKESPTANAPTTSQVHFFGVLRVPAPDGDGEGKRKVFSGVLVEADGGPTWVASYESNALWKAFDGRRVEITGERYVPQDQALVAPHVRVKSLSLERSDPAAEFTRIEEETMIEGQLIEWTWPMGTKLAGEKMIRFTSAQGREFFIASKKPDVPIGKPCTVRARIVDPSPYNARPDGEWLWIFEVTKP